jgi:hypothetical protein
MAGGIELRCSLGTPADGSMLRPHAARLLLLLASYQL